MRSWFLRRGGRSRWRGQDAARSSSVPTWVLTYSRRAASMRCSQSSPWALNHARTLAFTGIVTSTIIVTSSEMGSRQCARSKNSLVRSGMSLVSISSSDIASILAQSVFEPLIEFSSLTALCPPERDDSDRLGIRLTEYDNDHTVAQQADTDPSILPIVLAIVKCDQHWTAKHMGGIGEVKAVPTDVERVLRWIPGEAAKASATIVRRVDHVPLPHRVKSPELQTRSRFAARELGQQGAVKAVGGLLTLAVPFQRKLDQPVDQGGEGQAARLPEVEGERAWQGVDLVDGDPPA